MTNAQATIQRLQEGNQRYFSHSPDLVPRAFSPEASCLNTPQQPLAIVLGCSDSRVPPEILFDANIGDLFVVRTAGNIAGPTQIGSIEFAALQFGTPLIVVLGHSGCGAVTATLECLQNGATHSSEEFQSTLDLIAPALDRSPSLLEVDEFAIRLESAVESNIRFWVDQIRDRPLLDQLSREKGLHIIGAQYSFQTGRVSFLQ